MTTGLLARLHLAMICLLDDRHGFDRNLDAEIAARDHDAVGGGDDVIELGERLVLLDLGDDRHALVPFRDERFGALDVFGRTHERERDVIDALLEPELEILEVARRDRRDVQRAVRSS